MFGTCSGVQFKMRNKMSKAGDDAMLLPKKGKIVTKMYVKLFVTICITVQVTINIEIYGISTYEVDLLHSVVSLISSLSGKKMGVNKLNIHIN